MISKGYICFVNDSRVKMPLAVGVFRLRTVQMANRMETYNLNAINKEKGNTTIKQILYNKNTISQS